LQFPQLIKNLIMKKATLTIKNVGSVIIAQHDATFEGETMVKAVGKALTGAWEKLTSQYDDPQVFINGIPLLPAQVKKLWKVSFIDFNLNFPVLRETLVGNFALLDASDRVDYIRHTDVNNYFKSQKSFTIEEAAAQAKEQLKKTKFGMSLVKDQAKSSVWTPQMQLAYENKQEANRQKRIAAKAQAQIK
jgi:hypothetical protein